MVSASGVPETKFLPSNLNELCDILNLLLQKKQAGINSDIINDETIATANKLLE